MKKILFIFLVFIQLPLFAQEGDILHDGLFWGIAGVSTTKQNTPWGVDLSVQNRMYKNFSRLQTILGTVHLNYRKPNQPWGFAVGYIGGVFEPLGVLHIAQGRINRFGTLANGKIPFLARLSYDRLWANPIYETDVRTPVNHRWRLLGQITPPITKKISGFLAFEPFIIRRGLWFSETRGQAGFRFLLKNANLDVLYFNRWLKPINERDFTRFEHVFQVIYMHRIQFKSKKQTENPVN
ncbi:MAG: hypothetical protein MUC49_04575 [Raineya sp.]|jgi:hypothetical protein|nr:hypothetical protein [Raineya sp.]